MTARKPVLSSKMSEGNVTINMSGTTVGATPTACNVFTADRMRKGHSIGNDALGYIKDVYYMRTPVE